MGMQHRIPSSQKILNEGIRELHDVLTRKIDDAQIGIQPFYVVFSACENINLAISGEFTIELGDTDTHPAGFTGAWRIERRRMVRNDGYFQLRILFMKRS